MQASSSTNLYNKSGALPISSAPLNFVLCSFIAPGAPAPELLAGAQVHPPIGKVQPLAELVPSAGFHADFLKPSALWNAQLSLFWPVTRQRRCSSRAGARRPAGLCTAARQPPGPHSRGRSKRLAPHPTHKLCGCARVGAGKAAQLARCIDGNQERRALLHIGDIFALEFLGTQVILESGRGVGDIPVVQLRHGSGVFRRGIPQGDGVFSGPLGGNGLPFRVWQLFQGGFPLQGGTLSVHARHRSA